MKVSVDGGLSYIEASSGVRVIYEDVAIGDESHCGELHLNATSEGVIWDLYAGRLGRTNQSILGTNCSPMDAIVFDLLPLKRDS